MHDAPSAQPGTDIEARRELLPAELAAPSRAGSMVAEFVNSIVEEVQARALEMIRAAAEGDDAGQREALESADRMRARIDAMTEELEDAAAQLRAESGRLAVLHQQTTAAMLTGGLAGSDTGERQALAEVARGLERGQDDPLAADSAADEPREEREGDAGPGDEEQDEGPHEVEIVHEPDEPEAGPDDEPADAEAVDGEVADETDDHPRDDSGEEEPLPEEALAEVEAEPEPLPEEALAEVEAEPEPLPEPEPQPELLPEERLAEPEAEPLPEERLAEPEAEPLPEEELARSEPEPLSEAGAEHADALAPGTLEDEEDPEELAEDQERFARMSDPELALAYSRALKEMDHEPTTSEHGARLLRYAGSALGEALTRASFADIGQGPPPLVSVPRLGRARRERAEAINTLRRACMQAIQEMSGYEETGSPG